jgi:glycosyltransferase involved in cell wall biosynthesis
MRIAVYNPAWTTYGGGEKYLGALAEDAASLPGARVTLITGTPGTDPDVLRARFGLRLEGIPMVHAGDGGVHRALAEADVAVILSNFRSFGLPAPRTVYALQIPYPRFTISRAAGGLLRGRIREAAKDLSRSNLLRDARRATRALTNSQFVADTLLRNHGVPSTVVHPPIDDFLVEGTPREKIILSVGRIFRGAYNDKRYDVLLHAFHRLHDTARSGWSYWIAGACGDDRRSQSFLAALRGMAAGLPVRFLVNAPFAEVRDAYNRASLFWHGAGFGVDEEREPERTEHFGMSTVEAMSAGCVPVVIRRGGQKEIVTDGVTGRLWETEDELVTRSRELMDNPDRRQIMGEAARAAYSRYTREKFRRSIQDLFRALG